MKQIGGVLHVDRRSSPRYGVRLRVLFPWGDRIFQAHTLDLSETGMRLETLADIDMDTSLVMHFAPTGESQTQRVVGKVVWKSPASGPQGMFRCGIHFEQLGEHARACIRQLLAEQAKATPPPLPRRQPQAPQAPTVPMDGPAAWANELEQAVRADHEKRAEQRREASALYTEALTAKNAQDYDKAINLLEQATALCPEASEIIEELAQVLYFKGDVVRAAELFDKALRTADGS